MRLILLFSLFLLVSCSLPLPEITGVDFDKWKNDDKGCRSDRKQFIEAIREQKDKLKGLSERDLIKVLGSPDRNDLSEHHGKHYYYFVDPGPGCNGTDTVGLALIVRFNATGVSKEVSIE